MPRKPKPVPPITVTPVWRELTDEAIREIVEIAKRAAARREELRSQMREALEASDVPRVLALARQMVESD